MAEALKRTTPLTILRLSLENDAKKLVPASVTFEVQLTGDPSARNFAPAYGWAESSSSMERGDAAEPGTATRLTLTSPELGLTFDPAVAADVLAGYQSLLDRAASALEKTVTKVLPEWRANSFIRFAREHTWLPTPKLTLPPEATRLLADVLKRVLREDEPLWLEFVEPVGYLPLVQWEEVLRPATSAPMLRLSPHAVSSVRSNSELTIVLACSVSSRKELPSEGAMRTMIDAICAHLPPGSIVHVFADTLVRPVIVSALGTGARPGLVRLHPSPPAARAMEEPAEGQPGTLDRAAFEARALREHPWVAWMTKELGGGAVDIVHWLSPGAYPEEGLLVAADPGEEPRPSSSASAAAGVRERAIRFVPVPALAAFLTQVGAWGAILTSPANRSALGLRGTADALARFRPGLSAMHDLSVDSASDAIRELYQFLFGEFGAPAPRASGLVTYSHPAWAGVASGRSANGESSSDASGSLMDAYRGVAVATQAIIESAGATPAWVAATQRIAEQTTSRFVSGPEASDPAAERGIAAALAVLQTVLDRKANPTVAPDVTLRSEKEAADA